MSRTTILFRRVVIGFQAPPDSRASLEIAAGMARMLRSELAGIFLEDKEFLDWCAGGPVRHLSSFGAEAVAPEALLREFSAAAALAQARLARVARALGLEARFETRRAELTDPGIAGPEDLLVVMEPASPSARHSHPFTGMLKRIAAISVPVLYVPHAAQSRSGPVIALAAGDGNEIAELAGHIARQFGEEYRVLDEADAERWLAGPAQERLIVIDRASPLLQDAGAFAALTARRKVPVLIAGSSRSATQED